MMELKVEFLGDVRCSECGAQLDYDVSRDFYNLEVAPCYDCIEKEKEIAYDDGYFEGQIHG